MQLFVVDVQLRGIMNTNGLIHGPQVNTLRAIRTRKEFHIGLMVRLLREKRRSQQAASHAKNRGLG
jgi:hypothetical protein